MVTALKSMRLLASCGALAVFLLFSPTASYCSCAATAAARSARVQTEAPPSRSSSAVSGKLTAQAEPPRDLTEMVKEKGSQVLAQAIIYLRDLALQDAKPIPLEVQVKLAPFFPASLLEKVRYSIAWNPLVRSALRELIETDRYSLAFTLDDVIVFADEGGVDDLWLWAHELTHVQQYARWGVETFARFYIDNHRQVEKEAHEYANQVMRKIVMLSSTHNRELSKEHP